MAKLTDLPADILYCIFPYLDAVEYLSLTGSSRLFLSYREDEIFWHALTRKTFRIPDQPLLQNAQWHWLFRKLLTQTRLYTWGSGGAGNLGHAQMTASGPVRRSRGIPGNCGWPKQPVLDDTVGIVADVQCGGWSTTILNSNGVVFVLGRLDGTDHRHIPPSTGLRRLEFPPAYPPTTPERYEPSTAIQQLSTGRSSVLGLADDGKVWMWQLDMGFLVKPMHVDLMMNKVTRVAAGWDRNSMYVNDVGIVYWTSVQDSDYLQGGRQETLAVADMMLIETVTIPGTGLRQRKGNRVDEQSLESRIGKVTRHVVLADYIVFTTDLNKVFFYPTIFPMPALDIPEPIELTTFYTTSSSQPFKIHDLQGSFQRFAVFTEAGSVLMGSQDLLNTYREASMTPSQDQTSILPRPTQIPSLQSANVVSIAFGDHHFHALHGDGTVTAYGKELQKCGALGLGHHEISPLRGTVGSERGWGDMVLPDDEGSTVWFEPLMETWLEQMRRKANEPEARERWAMLTRDRKPFADHFEQEGAKWEESAVKNGDMGAYFVIKVASAGWHSAALVLENDEKAEKARNAHILKPRPSPSPAQSAISKDSREVVEAPGEQLSNALGAIGSWFWQLGRRFLGLTERDARKEIAEEREEAERMEDRVEYSWSQDPFPRLRLSDGTLMSGDIAVEE